MKTGGSARNEGAGCRRGGGKVGHATPPTLLCVQRGVVCRAVRARKEERDACAGRLEKIRSTIKLHELDGTSIIHSIRIKMALGFKRLDQYVLYYA